MIRANAVLDEAEKLGCRSFLRPIDVVNGVNKLNVAFVANLFNKHPALHADPSLVEEEVLQTAEDREEKTYRNWMNSLGVNPYVNCLYSDLCDGLIIFQLYDIIQPGVVNWNRVCR